jgi:hypothetical protein
VSCSRGCGRSSFVVVAGKDGRTFSIGTARRRRINGEAVEMARALQREGLVTSEIAVQIEGLRKVYVRRSDVTAYRESRTFTKSRSTIVNRGGHRLEPLEPGTLGQYLIAFRLLLDHVGVEPNVARDPRVKLPSPSDSAGRMSTLLAYGSGCRGLRRS